MSEQTVQWKGVSGRTYDYWVYPINTTFKDQPGNYTYAKKNSAGRWVAVYIGQTVSLAQRIANHEREEAAVRKGATHMHAHLSAYDEQSRRDEEADLIRAYHPPCNEQL